MIIADEEDGEPRGYEKIPAVVFARLLDSEIRIVLYPGYCGTRDIPLDLVPPALRVPNTRIWVRLDDQMAVVRVWRRTVATAHEST